MRNIIMSISDGGVLRQSERKEDESDHPQTPIRSNLFTLQTPKKSKLPRTPNTRTHSVIHSSPVHKESVSTPGTIDRKTRNNATADSDPFIVTGNEESNVRDLFTRSETTNEVGGLGMAGKRPANDDIGAAGNIKHARVQVSNIGYFECCVMIHVF